MDILHWDDFSKHLQAIHILDLTAELGAVENRNHKGLSQSCAFKLVDLSIVMGKLAPGFPVQSNYLLGNS